MNSIQIKLQDILEQLKKITAKKGYTIKYVQVKDEGLLQLFFLKI